MTNHDQVAMCTEQYIEYKQEKLKKVAERNIFALRVLQAQLHVPFALPCITDWPVLQVRHGDLSPWYYKQTGASSLVQDSRVLLAPLLSDRSLQRTFPVVAGVAHAHRITAFQHALEQSYAKCAATAFNNTHALFPSIK